MPGRHPAASFCSATPPAAQTWHESRTHGFRSPEARSGPSCRLIDRARREVTAWITTGPRERARCSRWVHPRGPPKRLLHLPGEPAGHVETDESGEGLLDHGTFGMGEGVHDRGRVGDGQVGDPHPDTELHVVHGGHRVPTLRPRTGVPEAADHEQFLARVEGTEVDRALMEGHLLTLGGGVRLPRCGAVRGRWGHLPIMARLGRASKSVSRSEFRSRNGGSDPGSQRRNYGSVIPWLHRLTVRLRLRVDL